MRNLFILLKNNFNMMIGSMKRNNKNRSDKSVIFLFLFLALFLVAIFSYNAYNTINGFRDLGEKFAIFNGLFTILVTLLVLGCLRATSQNAQNSDSDFLLSLPIKKYTIILSKTLNKYIYDLFFTLVIFAPYVVIYSIFYGVSFQFIIMSILIILLLPLLSVGLTYVVDFFITRLFNKTKFAGILKSLFSLFLFGMAFVFIIVSSMDYSFLDATSLENYFASRPFTNLLLNFIFSPNVLNIILTLLLTIGVLGIGTLLFTLNYGKSFASYKSNKTTLDFTSPKSPFCLLFKKEANYYFSSPTYMLNTAIGPVMMIVFLILILSLNLPSMLGALGISNVNEYIMGLSTLVFCFMSCTSTISASAISLEGKNLWFLKALPINIQTIFFSKLALHNIVVIPILIIVSILMSIILKFSFLYFLFLFILPILLTLDLSILGLYINLKFPVFDFDDEARVVKQSMSVILSLLIGMVISLIPLVLYLITPLTITIICFITLFLFILLFVIFSLLLFTNGVKLFKNL